MAAVVPAGCVLSEEHAVVFQFAQHIGSDEHLFLLFADSFLPLLEAWQMVRNISYSYPLATKSLYRIYTEAYLSNWKSVQYAFWSGNIAERFAKHN